MSSMNVVRIARCFLNALRALQKELNVKGAVPRDIEVRAALMIDAMQHLCIKTESDVLWRDSCEVIYSLGDLFVNSHGQLIKHTYCQALEHLVIPVASTWSPHVNSQRWKDFLNIVNMRLSQMLMKPRHWQEAFRLSIIVLLRITNGALCVTLGPNSDITTSKVERQNDPSNGPGGYLQACLDLP